MLSRDSTLLHLVNNRRKLEGSKIGKVQVYLLPRDYAKSSNQLMADLSSLRLLPFTPLFHVSSCDYFGPFKVKISRKKTTKHYGVISTRLNTRAVHLEMAVDCYTMDFLQVLRRFFSIRGYPKLMLSDSRA